MKCPFCEQEIEEGSALCPSCGQSLGADNQPAAEVVPVAENPVAENAAEDAGAAVAPAEVVTSDGKQSNSKKKIVIGAVVAIAVVVAAGVALMPKKSAKDTVIDAFKSIVAEGQTNPMEEIFGSKTLSEKLRKENSEIEFDMQIAGSSNETVNQLATGEIGVTVKSDITNKKMSYLIGVGFADMDIANLEFYSDDKQFAIAIPELSDKAFSLNYADDLEGQIERSPFIGEAFDEYGINAAGFGSYFTKANEMSYSGKQFFNMDELWTRYKEGSKAIDDLKASMTVADAEKKTFTIEGKEQNCKGYNVTITKDALIQFATTTKEFFLADETLKKDFVDYMSMVLELQKTMTGIYGEPSIQSPEQLQEDTWRSAEESVDSFIEQLKESMGDLTMVVHVAKGDKMASFDYSTTAKIDEEDIKLYGTVTFAGGYSMMSNVKATLNVEDAAAEVITITMDKTGTYEAGKNYGGALNLSMTNGTDTYSMLSGADYAVEGGTYSMMADFQNNGSSAGKVTISGLVQNLVKGESFEMIVDSMKLESPLITGMDEYIDFSGRYKVAPLSTEVEPLAGESFDILAGTEEEWIEVVTEIMGNAYGLMMSFYE